MADHVTELDGASRYPSGPVPAAETRPRFRRGDAGLRRVSFALFLAGLATFTLLYETQALLPLVSRSYGAGPAEASLTVSVATGALAVAVIPVSSLSEVAGRRTVMTVCVLAAAVLGLLAPLSPAFWILLACRALQGAALAGVPAVAMAYLAEEVDRGSLGQAMGLYIAGNAIGGLTGRIGASVLADAGGWRVGLAGVGIFSLACAVVFHLVLPPSAHFRSAPVQFAALARSLRGHLADAGLVRLYVIAFALMGSFVTVYNYLTYRLEAAPFRLSQTVIGLIFLAYLAGTASSAVAGRLADRAGRRNVMWTAVVVAVAGVAMTLSASLAVIIGGIVLLTIGFFGAHSVASGWVTRRARIAPAQASALYLFAYYLGSSICGSAGGLAYGRGGWDATAAFAGVLLLIGLTCALSLRRASMAGNVRGLRTGVRYRLRSPGRRSGERPVCRGAPQQADGVTGPPGPAQSPRPRSA
jgi:YNFM family putative membrane transporter